jgi:hypothetical protein
MNILLEPSYFYKNNEYELMGKIHFLDTKPNNIMEGEFTKLIFSNIDFSLNGLYLLVNLDNIEERPCENKNKFILKFPSNNLNNISLIHSIVQIEQRILDVYSKYKKPKKYPKYALHQQLTNGFLHAYYESNKYKSKYMLKISGVWETAQSYGITYKFSKL